MTVLDPAVYPHLGVLWAGTEENLIPNEQADFLAATQTALSLPDSPGRHQLLRCLDIGVASLSRRRELARENDALLKRLDSPT